MACDLKFKLNIAERNNNNNKKQSKSGRSGRQRVSCLNKFQMHPDWLVVIRSSNTEGECRVCATKYSLIRNVRHMIACIIG